MAKKIEIDYDDEECASFFSAINEIEYYVKMIEKQCKALYQNNVITEIAAKNTNVMESLLHQRIGYYESMSQKGEWGTSKDVLTYTNGHTDETCAERVEKKDYELLEKVSCMYKGLERVCSVRTRKNFRPSEYSKNEDRAIYSDLIQTNQNLSEILQMDYQLLEPYQREIQEANQKRRYREKRGRILSKMKRIAIVAGIAEIIIITGLNVVASMGRNDTVHKNTHSNETGQVKKNKTVRPSFEMPASDAVIQKSEYNIRNDIYLRDLTYDKLKERRGLMTEEVYQEGLKMLAEEAVEEMSPGVIACLADAERKAKEDKNNLFADSGIIVFGREDKDIAIDCMKLFYHTSMNDYDPGQNTSMAREAYFFRYATTNLINYSVACLFNKPIGSTAIYSKTLDKASFVWKKDANTTEALGSTIYLGHEKNGLEKFLMQSIKLAPLCRKNPAGVNDDVEYNNVVSSFLKGREFSFETLLDMTSVIEQTKNINQVKMPTKGESR